MSLKDHSDSMAKMYADGYSLSEIARNFGTTRQRVHQLIRGTYDRPHYGQLRRERYESSIRAAHARILEEVSDLATEAEQLGIKPNSLRVAFHNKGLTLPGPPPAPEHGTPYRYKTGCRCAECKAAVREYRNRLIAKGPKVHGTVSAYRNYACRCDECRAAGSVANRIDREKRLQRRRQATPLDS